MPVKLKTATWLIAVYVLSFLCYLPMLLRHSGAALPDAILGTKYVFVIVPALISAVFLAREHNLKAYWPEAFKRISVKELILCLIMIIIGVLTTLFYSFRTNTALFQETYPSIMSFAASCIYLFATALLEEAAWRGYFFKRMAADSNALAAALLTGAAWAVWHIPMWTIRNSMKLPDVGLLFIWTVLVSVVLGTAYSTFENVLSAALLHMSFNVFYLAPIACNSTILFLAMIIYYVYRKNPKRN